MPKIINVIHESLKNVNSIKISTNDIGILIKLLLFILTETNQVKLTNQDKQLLLLVIDSSMVLLNKSVEIKLPKINNWFCC